LTKENVEYFTDWNEQPLRTNFGHYELLEDGNLVSKDGSLLFFNDNITFSIPIFAVKSINVYSNINIESKVLSLLHDNDVNLSFFSKKGKFIGRIENEHSTQRSDIFLKQCCLYNNSDERLKISKQFVIGEVHAIQEMIHLFMNAGNVQRLSAINEQLTKAIAEVKSVSDYSKLLLVEARAREKYYSVFNDVIHNNEFRYIRRSKRPPLDPINALISFGNMVVYNYIANEIQRTALDIKVGFLHATGLRNESLNLDISELFKPQIVDYTIIHCINEGVIVSDHFIHDNDAVYLNSDGKKIFLECLYSRIYNKDTYYGEFTNYQVLIRNEIYRFQKCLEDNKEYIALDMLGG